MYQQLKAVVSALFGVIGVSGVCAATLIFKIPYASILVATVAVAFIVGYMFHFDGVIVTLKKRLYEMERKYTTSDRQHCTALSSLSACEKRCDELQSQVDQYVDEADEMYEVATDVHRPVLDDLDGLIKDIEDAKEMLQSLQDRAQVIYNEQDEMFADTDQTLHNLAYGGPDPIEGELGDDEDEDQ